jgi:hypothetical protein
LASEIRRAAQALVATHTRSFPSRFSRAESVVRLTAALGAIVTQSGKRAAVRGVVTADRVDLEFGRQLGKRSQCSFKGAWSDDGEVVRLDGAFIPVARTRRFLSSVSLVMSLLILASLWAIFSPNQDATMKVLVPIFTALSILAFPYVVVAMASHREVEEQAIAKVVGVALAPAQDADARGS